MPETVLLNYLEENGIPHAHLARKLNISRAGFSHKIYGRLGNRFSYEQREVIAATLRKPFAELFPEAVEVQA